MAIKGGRKHIKKLAAPKAWSILRKDHVWTTKSAAGKHSIEKSMPIVTVIRDMLGYADSHKEAKKIIKNKEILIDGVVVREPKCSVGFMDVISVPRAKKNYRVTFTRKGKITVLEIPSENSKFKLCRIDGKTVIKAGKIQLNMHDGRTYLVGKNEKYNTGDSVKMEIPKQKISDHFELKKGNVAYVLAGKYAGEIVKIKDIVAGTMTRNATVIFENGHKTLKEYVFVIGKDKPAVSISKTE